MNRYKYLFISFFIIHSTFLYAQDDLMALLEDNTEKKEQKVYATFKSVKIINAQSIETVKLKTLDFRITHRFGNIGTQSGGGVHTLYGFDNATNIRFSFDYGVTDKLTVGVGRSKVNEHLDGSIKYKIIEQTTNNKMPISVVLYSNMAITPRVNVDSLWSKFIHRFSYVYHLIVARKFSSRFSAELLPMISHRNYVVRKVNDNNAAEEENTIFALGIAGRIKITNRTSIVADYFYVFSNYRKNNLTDPYYMPLGIGTEIETGGHVFHINLTNSAGIIENDFIPNTNETWTKGGYKFGFNISRVFNL